MANLRNFGITEGRLTKDPVVFNNKDGSRKIMITVAAQNSYKNKAGVRESQFLPFEAFVPAANATNGVFDYTHKGDLVGIEYEVRNNNYKDPKTGEDVYGIVLFVQNVDLKEGKAKTDARQAAAQTEAAATEEPAEKPAPAKKSKKAVAKEDAPFS